MTASADDKSGLLYGVPAIASYLRLTPRAVYHLHASRRLPTFKLGGKVCASRTELEAHFAERSAAARTA